MYSYSHPQRGDILEEVSQLDRLPRADDDLFTAIPRVVRTPSPHIPILQSRASQSSSRPSRKFENDQKQPQTKVFLPSYYGNLAVDYPVPARLLRQIPHPAYATPVASEFSHVRYTAVTCPWSQFLADGYVLRQNLFGKPRKTKLLIVVTMWNEDHLVLGRTLRGLFANLASSKWKEDTSFTQPAWKQIVVCIISDGRAKINPASRALLAALGVYLEGVAKQSVNNEETVAHLYEYTTQMSLHIQGDSITVAPSTGPPCQMLFCLKERWDKLVNSYFWAFKAFGPALGSEVLIFLNAGAEPGKDSIYHLWNAFQKDPRCGSATGETFLSNVTTQSSTLVNMIECFEHRTRNSLRRPFDSACGLRFDVPGAMFAYRLAAIQGSEEEYGPLDRFLRAVERSRNWTSYTRSFLYANMILAQDRLLSFELIAKKSAAWTAAFVPRSVATLEDALTNIGDYVLYQRRQINGNLLATMYAITQSYRLFHTQHTFFQKSRLLFGILHHTLSWIIIWLSPALWYTLVHLAISSLRNSPNPGVTRQFISGVTEFAYGLGIASSFLAVSGQTPSQVRWYSAICLLWSIVAGLTYVTYIASFKEEIFHSGVITSDIRENFVRTSDLNSSVTANILPVAVIAVCYTLPLFVSTSLTQALKMSALYLIYIPIYIHTILGYALFNLHDVPWGSVGFTAPKGLPQVSGKAYVSIEDALDPNREYDASIKLLKTRQSPAIRKSPEDDLVLALASTRSLIVLCWIIPNALLIKIIGNSNKDSSPQYVDGASWYLAVGLWSFAALTVVKTFGAAIYLQSG